MRSLSVAFIKKYYLFLILIGVNFLLAFVFYNRFDIGTWDEGLYLNNGIIKLQLNEWSPFYSYLYRFFYNFTSDQIQLSRLVNISMKLFMAPTLIFFCVQRITQSSIWSLLTAMSVCWSLYFINIDPRLPVFNFILTGILFFLTLATLKNRRWLLFLIFFCVVMLFNRIESITYILIVLFLVFKKYKGTYNWLIALSAFFIFFGLFHMKYQGPIYPDRNWSAFLDHYYWAHQDQYQSMAGQLDKKKIVNAGFKARNIFQAISHKPHEIFQHFFHNFTKIGSYFYFKFQGFSYPAINFFFFILLCLGFLLRRKKIILINTLLLITAIKVLPAVIILNPQATYLFDFLVVFQIWFFVQLFFFNGMKGYLKYVAIVFWIFYSIQSFYYKSNSINLAWQIKQIEPFLKAQNCKKALGSYTITYTPLIWTSEQIWSLDYEMQGKSLSDKYQRFSQFDCILADESLYNSFIDIGLKVLSDDLKANYKISATKK